MNRAWVLDLRQSPPAVVAHVEGDDSAFLKSISLLAAAFPEYHMVIVVEASIAYYWKDGQFVERQ